MTDNLLDKDDLTVADIIADANEAPYHTILHVWREVLKPAAAESRKKITPQWATKIVARYSGITYADMPRFRDLYFGSILALAEILEAEIDGDDECLKHATAEEDVEHNTTHYLNVLISWQLQFMQWEIDWEPTSPDAAVQIAALGEVHQMFFGPEALTALLDQINFQFTDDDRELMSSALQSLLEGESDEEGDGE